MSTYQRTTRECSFEQLSPEFQQAFTAYYKSHDLGEPDAQNLLCSQTVAVRQEGSGLPAWLTGETEAAFTTVIMLGAERVMWARAGDPLTLPLHVNSAKMFDIRVDWFTDLFTKNRGLLIACIFEGSNSISQGKIYLGGEPAAREFYEAVTQAVEKVNPKSKRRFPAWMGGQ